MNCRDERLNYFSHWYPKIKDCGLNVPKSVVVPIEDNSIYTHFYMENPVEDSEAVHKWVRANLIPRLQEEGLDNTMLFMKNAVFSNKFSAHDCLTDVTRLDSSMLNINFNALCLGADGITEVVVRERIMGDGRSPTIYGGLVFRPEFRVFYDFDTNKVLFSFNYWDYDYVYPNLYNENDKLVFNARKEDMEYNYNKYVKEVEDMVSEAMKNVSGFDGAWSIDIMMEDFEKKEDTKEEIDASLGSFIDEKGNSVQKMAIPRSKPKFYLIDMALAERSAYWEKRPNTIGE